MPLNWYVEKVKKHAELTTVIDPKTGDKYWNPITQCLAFYTQCIGISSITEKNAEKFFTRMQEHFEISGGFYYSWKDMKCFVYINKNNQEIPEDFLKVHVAETDIVDITKPFIRIKRELTEAEAEDLGVSLANAEESKDMDTYKVVEYFHPTLEDVKDHIGMYTNANTYNETEWKKQKQKIKADRSKRN